MFIYNYEVINHMALKFEFNEVNPQEGTLDYTLLGSDSAGPFTHQVVIGPTHIDGELLGATVASSKCPQRSYEFRINGLGKEQVFFQAAGWKDYVKHPASIITDLIGAVTGSPLKLEYLDRETQEGLAARAQETFGSRPCDYAFRYEREGILCVIQQMEREIGLPWTDLMPETVWERLREWYGTVD